MLKFKPITQEKFNEFVNSDLQLIKDFKGAFYHLKSLKQFLFFTGAKSNKFLIIKLTNRKAKFIYESSTNKFYFALIQYETSDQYLSINKLFKDYHFKNRFNNLYLKNNIIEYENERTN